MGSVVSDISMSLDGFITGPNDSVDSPLGDGGERLHQWVYELESWRERQGMSGGKRGPDSEIFEEAFKNVGAVLMGRRMFDVGEKPWGDNPPFHMPVFVVTHRPRKELVKDGGTTFTFVGEGIEKALEQAGSAAGAKAVSVAGGANIIQQCLTARVLDEIQIHLVPILLGGGRRLFDDLANDIDLERTRVRESPAVTHLKFRLVK